MAGPSFLPTPTRSLLCTVRASVGVGEGGGCQEKAGPGRAAKKSMLTE